VREPGMIDHQFRKALGEARITQRQLAERVGISHVLLSLYTRGRWILRETEKQKIAKVLRMPVENVFTNWEAESN
jgi:transcriptional regulator with XRE-family HTH domain